MAIVKKPPAEEQDAPHRYCVRRYERDDRYVE